jgi:hypothetical protein
MAALEPRNFLQPCLLLLREQSDHGYDLTARLRPLHDGEADAGGVYRALRAMAQASGDHGFHVFGVYPWSRLLGSGMDHPRHVLDSCRIRWGTVTARSAEGVDVETRRLTWDGTVLALGERIEPDHVQVVAEVGDTVAMHWEWLCDHLTPDQATTLERSTHRHLAATTLRLSR